MRRRRAEAPLDPIEAISVERDALSVLSELGIITEEEAALPDRSERHPQTEVTQPGFHRGRV